jgi:hypothetical protein
MSLARCSVGGQLKQKYDEAMEAHNRSITGLNKGAVTGADWGATDRGRVAAFKKLREHDNGCWVCTAATKD